MLTEEAGLNGHLSISENFTYMRKCIPENRKSFSYSGIRGRGSGIRITISNFGLRIANLGRHRAWGPSEIVLPQFHGAGADHDRIPWKLKDELFADEN